MQLKMIFDRSATRVTPVCRAGQACYRQFCASFGIAETPASDATLTYSLPTARQYLAAVRRLHLQHGVPLPPGLPPYAEAALQVYQTRGIQQQPGRLRHALIGHRLVRFKAGLIGTALCVWDQRCLWAAPVAVTLAFFWRAACKRVPWGNCRLEA